MGFLAFTLLVKALEDVLLSALFVDAHLKCPVVQYTFKLILIGWFVDWRVIREFWSCLHNVDDAWYRQEVKGEYFSL